MPSKRIEDFAFREFRVVVVHDGAKYVAAGFDPKRNEIARAASAGLDAVRADIRNRLLRQSEGYTDVAGAIRLFLDAHPQGFADAQLEEDQRGYKFDAHRRAIDLLAKDRIKAMLAAGDHAGIASTAKKIFTNLVFPNEAMAFGEFLKRGGPRIDEFADQLFLLLHGQAFDSAFDRIAALLKPFGAARWPVLSYWPIILRPKMHMIVKPEVARDCAWRLGEDFGYESYPSAAIYRRFLSFVDRLRTGIAPLKPRDNIDVLSFMYAIARKDGAGEAEGAPARQRR
jgi:hypothetical protein